VKGMARAGVAHAATKLEAMKAAVNVGKDVGEGVGWPSAREFLLSRAAGA
jgi:hypothetical protein